MRLAAAAAPSSQPPKILPLFVPFISQYYREYTTWKPHNHSKAIAMKACASSAKFKAGMLVENPLLSGMITAPGRRYAIRSPDTTEAATPR
jgi:hypothetical protein